MKEKIIKFVIAIMLTVLAVLFGYNLGKISDANAEPLLTQSAKQETPTKCVPYTIEDLTFYPLPIDVLTEDEIKSLEPNELNALLVQSMIILYEENKKLRELLIGF